MNWKARPAPNCCRLGGSVDRLLGYWCVSTLTSAPFCSVRHYISAQGISIRNAKEFLERQTRSMSKRRTALKAARQQWRHDMQQAQEAVQDPDSSQLLEDVRQNLEEVTTTALAQSVRGL